MLPQRVFDTKKPVFLGISVQAGANHFVRTQLDRCSAPAGPLEGPIRPPIFIAQVSHPWDKPDGRAGPSGSRTGAATQG